MMTSDRDHLYLMKENIPINLQNKSFPFLEAITIKYITEWLLPLP